MNVERQTTTSKLEPRVAKLELGLDRLTDDVRDLAGVVRKQGANMEQEIQKLVVAVTQASGPRKTDWSTIIAAVMMVMAIGAAVLVPLNQISQDNKREIEKVQTIISDHMKQDGHPVSITSIQRLEDQIKMHNDNDDRKMVEDRNELMQWRQKAMGLNSSSTNK